MMDIKAIIYRTKKGLKRLVSMGTKTIVGIDVGTANIKVLVLKQRLSNMNIEAAYLKRLHLNDSESNATEIRNCIKKILKEYKGDNIVPVVSMSSSKVTLRNMQMPFKDVDKIRKVIKFEIEPKIPFPIDEVIVDFYLCGKLDAKEDIITAVTKKSVVNEWLNMFSGAGINPRIIELDNTALYNAVLKLGYLDNKNTFVLIDLGASKAGINIVKAGKLKYMRNISTGGGTLTAQGDAIDRLEMEIARTMNAYKARNGEFDIKSVIIAGGGAALEGVSARLEKFFKVPIIISDPIPTLKNKISDEIPACIFTNSLGLIQRAANKKLSGIDFRQEEFAFRPGQKAAKKRYLFTGIISGLILLLSVSNFYITLNKLEKKHNMLRREIRGMFNEALPNVHNIVNEVLQMKHFLTQEKEEFKDFSGFSRKRRSSLDTLKEISSAISKDVKVVIPHMVITQESITIKGRSDSFRSINKLKDEIEKSDYFDTVKVSNIVASKDGKSVSFRFIISTSDK